jgi:amidase
LDQELRQTTIEMVRWLKSDFGLNAYRANLLLGMGVEYEVVNVFDRAYSMVCKVSREVLQRISGKG